MTAVRPTFPAWVIAPAAVLLTLTQIGLAIVASGQPDVWSGWRSLYGWDGGWFLSVVESGYHAPPELSKADPGNVAFYPAYPLAARGVRAVSGLDIPAALLVTGQLACVGVWAYFLLLLRQFRVSPGNAVLVTALFAAHPAFVFLVASYSESTFLFGLLGFVYWCRRTGPAAFALAAAHGAVMTAARLVGLPVAILPLLLAACGGSPRAWVRAGGLAVLASAGAVAYFAFLHFAFGRWDLFAVSHRVGWDVNPDWLAFFRIKTWDHRFADLYVCHTDQDAASRMAFPLTVFHFLLLAVLEVLAVRAGSTGWRVRLPLLVAAAFLFALPVVSHSTRGVSSMGRFALTWHAVLGVVAGSVLTDGPKWVRAWWARVPVVLGGVWSANVQWGMTALYTAGTFVG
jgi:hypothetical protein